MEKYLHMSNICNFEGTLSESHLEITVAVSCNWHIIRPIYINMQAHFYFLSKLFAHLIILLLLCGVKGK